MPKPHKNIKAKDKVRKREKEKATKARPNKAAETEMSVSKPKMFFREARYNAPRRAPTPEEPIRKPKVYGPPCSIFLAKTGISIA